MEVLASRRTDAPKDHHWLLEEGERMERLLQRKCTVHDRARYDKLLGAFRKPGKQSDAPTVSVVGVTVMSDGLVGAAMSAYLEETVRIWTESVVLKCYISSFPLL